MKLVGIIGGMGPLASIDLYTKITHLTPALKDQDHIPLMIDSYPQIPDRTAFILGSGENPLPKLLESAKRLEQAGCQGIAIACNTAHYFVEQIQQEIRVPIIHIAESAVIALEKDFSNVKKVAVIATTGTKRSGIYDHILAQHNLISVDLSYIEQDNIMACIYNGVKKGNILGVVDLFNQTVSEINADVYIAGCTEIPLLLPYLKRPYQFIDATLELAKSIIQFSLTEH